MTVVSPFSGTQRLQAGSDIVMRARSIVVCLLLAAAAACAHEPEHAPVQPRHEEPRTASGPSSGPTQYLVADPNPRVNVIAIPLEGSALGLVVDKSRIIAGRGEPRVGAETTEATITHAKKLPPRFGGGFVFLTDNAIYRSDTFDGSLKPIARVPDTISDFSFMPKGILVRSRNGERWGIAPNGDRVAIEPLGAADVEALDDGRVIAFNDQGAAFTSTDSGLHWTDITAQIRSSPQAARNYDDELWILESAGTALKLEGDGRITAYDKQPPEKPAELRAKDPRWRGADTPLRAAFTYGASLDESTAIVADEGDIFRIDVRTGEIASVVAGKLPPDSRCTAVPTSNDVLLACVSKNARSAGSYGPASAFVASHVLGGEDPQIEQSFSAPGMFYASDDGGLAFGGPCNGVQPQSGSPVVPGACVRQPGGAWEDVDLSALANDAGGTDMTVTRWVPRSDGHIVAFVLEPQAGIFDPRSGTLTTVPDDSRDTLSQGLSAGYARYYRKGYYYGGGDGGIVDWSWSYSPSGTLRGWQRHGGIVEIGESGRVTKSPYAFDIVASSSFALGRTQDGRLFQSTDHGTNWIEVAAPPGGAQGAELHACTSAGCDLGGFYRIGWQPRPPHAEAAHATPPPVPEVRRQRPLELSCRPAGAVAQKALPRTDRSPDDLGLGATRLAVSDDKGEITYIRNVVPKGIVNPIHDPGGSDNDNASVRALFSGFGTQRDSDVITVMGPNKNAQSLRRAIQFVPAFDPSATVKKATLAMSDVINVARGLGMSTDEILSDDMTESGDILLVTPSDPNAPSDLGFHNTRGLVAWMKSSERTKLAMRPPANDSATLVSGGAVTADEVAFLELETTGVAHVWKLGPGGATDLFDLSPTANNTDYYPSNPDAIAIGPKGEIGVLRTPSGSDPPSAVDPAMILQPALPPAPLAPWSTLKFADDPACKSETGWRATVQAIAPWVRVTTPELHVDDAPMVARVKWNDKRVCLEGFEVKLPPAQVRTRTGAGSDTLAVATWLVAKGSTFARTSVGEGFEWRQPLECSVVQP